MRFLLDTNVVSEVSKRRPFSKVLNFLQAHEAVCVVPSIVLAERYQGARTAPAEKREEMLAIVQQFHNEFADRILPFDAKAAEVWGEYTSRKEMRQQPKSYPDSQIAAIALANNLTVVTRNTADFPGVRTINPFED